MIDLLDKAIAKVKTLSTEAQDAIATIINFRRVRR